jgi:hypothetical protein
VAYQRDGHRLPECRLQSSQSRKLIANLRNTESWELSTLYWKLSNLPRYLPCEFSVDVPLPETTQHRDTNDRSSGLSTPHWTVQFSEGAWSSTTGSIITSQGKHWSKTARHTGPLQTSTNPQPMWSVHGCLQYATAIVTSPKQAPHRLGQSSAEKELRDRGRSEEHCRKRKEKPKNLQGAGIRVPKQKALACYARENAASKSHLLGRWKTQSAHRTPHLSFLPSVAASCVGLFFFYKISKLENLAIKLVEIGREKHKFPNFFLLKRGNFVF